MDKLNRMNIFANAGHFGVIHKKKPKNVEKQKKLQKTSSQVEDKINISIPKSTSEDKKTKTPTKQTSTTEAGVITNEKGEVTGGLGNDTVKFSEGQAFAIENAGLIAAPSTHSNNGNNPTALIMEETPSPTLSAKTDSVKPGQKNFPGKDVSWQTLKLSDSQIKDEFSTGRKFFQQMDRFQQEFRFEKADPQSKLKDCPLSTEEMAAVKDYTSGVYDHVNRHLRGNQTFFQKVLRYGAMGKYTKSLMASAKLTASALNKLPAYRDKDVYRAVNLPPEAAGAYKPGETITEQGFTSCSKSMKGMRLQPGHTVFVIRSKTGRDITDLSLSPHEEEVLFNPNTKFKVLGNKQQQTKVGKANFIYLEEQS